MKKFLKVTGLVTLGLLLFINIVKGQTSPSIALTSTTSTHTSCVVVSGATGMLCAASDGLAYANGSGAFALLSTSTTTAVQKVNGVAPGATGNVTIACPASAPTVTVTGATLTSNTTLLQLDSPTVAVAAPAVTCSATGS